MQRWLKLKDATKYSSIGKNRIIELAEKGIIKGFQDPDSKRGDWIFDVLSIDDYREKQALGSFPNARQKALEVMRGVRL